MPEPENQIDYHTPIEKFDFPTIYSENNQLVGHTSECKHCQQCGFMRAMCTNPVSPTKFCFFGWYTGGLIPDQLCQWFQQNPYWHSISTNYFINRNTLLDKVISDGKVKGEIPKSARTLGAIGEYIYKPLNIFLLGATDDISTEDLHKKYPWLKEGIGKLIQTVRYGEDIDVIEEELKNAMIKVPSMGFVPKLILAWKDNMSQDYISRISKIIEDFESVQSVNLATRLVHSQIIQENEYMNLARLNHDIWGYNLHKIFEGRTVLCIAGGPSLGPQLDLIREHQDKFVIICVSTVAELLFKNGITPHIIGTIDMKTDNKKYLVDLKQEWMDKSYFAYEIDAHREVIEAYKGKRIMIAADIDRAPITSPLKDVLPITFNIPKSGTVSNIIYTIAKLTNPKEIVLIGYDLCYVSNRSHADGTKYNMDLKVIKGDNGTFLQFDNSPNVEQAMQILTNNTDENGNNYAAYTTKSFYTYLIEIGLRINTEPKIKTYDAGLDSSKKDGAEYKSISDIIKTIETPKSNAFDELAKLSPKVTSNSTIKKYLKNIGIKTNKTDIKFNHVSKLTYIMRQYQQYPILKYGKILHRIEEFVNKETNNEIEKLANEALTMWRELNKEEQNENN